MVIVIIHSIVKNISEGMGNGEISKITYYVEYILIVTLIMTNFSEIIVMIKDTVNSLVGFLNSLVPILLTLMITTRKFSDSIYHRAYFAYGYNICRKYYIIYFSSTNIGTEQHLV